MSGDMTQDAETDFIEGMGLILQGDGMPRIAGRLMGLFVLRGGPFSFTELAETLEISRGSVSTNTRLLEDLGVIERVAIRGERQDFFRLAADPYAQIIERKRIRSIRAQEAIRRSADELTDAGAEAVARIGALGDFFGVLAQATERALEDLAKTDGTTPVARVTVNPSSVAAE
jgi:DNA-binding transcriptional regulator GbsR (MarR family)